MGKRNTDNVRDDGVTGFILKGGATSMLVRVSGLLLGLLSHVMISRALGAEHYGLYGMALAWCLILVVPVKFGLDQTVLKYAAIYVAGGHQLSLKSLIRYSAGFLSIAFVLVAGGLTVFFYHRPSLLPVSTAADFGWLLLLLGALALLGVFSNYFRAIRKVFESQFYEQVFRSACLIILVALCHYVLQRSLDLSAALMLTALSAALAALFMLYRFKTAFIDAAPARAVATADEAAVSATRSEWFHFGRLTFFIAIAQQITSHSNIILVGWLAGSAQAGQYAVAVRLSSLLAFALVAIGAISGPLVAVAYQRSDLAQLKKIACVSARAASGFALAGTALLVVLGDRIIALFGQGFDDAYSPMLILTAGTLVSAFTGIAGLYLTMTNRQGVALKILLVSMCTNLVLALWLIPRFGAAGAAIAAAAALAVSRFAMVLFVRKRIGVDTTACGLAVKKIDQTGI